MPHNATARGLVAALTVFLLAAIMWATVQIFLVVAETSQLAVAVEAEWVGKILSMIASAVMVGVPIAAIGGLLIRRWDVDVPSSMSPRD